MSPTTATRRFALPRLLLALALALGVLTSLPVPQARADTLTVTNGNDSGPGSLREAIADAEDGDAIVFADDVTTVTLTTERLLIQNKGLTIRGSGEGVTIRRSNALGTPEFPILVSNSPQGVTVERVTITNGKGANSGGIAAAGKLTLIDSTVSGNTAGERGGGISHNAYAPDIVQPLTLTNSTISGNVAGYGGGGIFSEHVVTLTNSTISGNSAGDRGGGVFVEGGFVETEISALVVTNSTIVDNEAPLGAGIHINDNYFGGPYPNPYVPGSAILRHSIVAGNGMEDCTSEVIDAPIFSSHGYNLVGNGTGCPSTGPGDLILTGPLATAINPNLANNGGPTRTHMPVLGGPAVNWIPPTECIPTTDQRGIDRPRDGACDIGAVEYAPMVSLTVAPVGPGSITRSPVGIGEGLDTYPSGTPVTFTAQPSRGAIFTGWRVDGAARGWANQLTVVAGTFQEVQAIFVPPVSFPDVPTGRGDQTAIVELASRGTILGYGNGDFGPDDGVTRAQMAALIARAMPAGPGTPPTMLEPPDCIAAGTWDCEEWGNTFTDQSGVSDALWRDVAALQQHRVAYGYGVAECAARGLDAPCFGPNDPVTYAQTISFIARAMREKGYWTDQPGATLPYVGIPADHQSDARTFHFYTHSLGGIPIPPGDWDAPATRGWFARALWVALDSYWGAVEP